MSQEIKVRIDITCIYDRVLLIHVDTCSTTPSPAQPVLQTTTLGSGHYLSEGGLENFSGFLP